MFEPFCDWLNEFLGDFVYVVPATVQHFGSLKLPFANKSSYVHGEGDEELGPQYTKAEPPATPKRRTVADLRHFINALVVQLQNIGNSSCKLVIVIGDGRDLGVLFHVLHFLGLFEAQVLDRIFFLCAPTVQCYSSECVVSARDLYNSIIQLDFQSNRILMSMNYGYYESLRDMNNLVDERFYDLKGVYFNRMRNTPNKTTQRTFFSKTPQNGIKRSRYFLFSVGENSFQEAAIGQIGLDAYFEA